MVEGSGASVSYGLDSFYRLTSDSRTGAGAYSHSYSLDLNGNLTSVNGSAFAAYDSANKIYAIAGGSVSYDADGNLTSVSSAAVPSGAFVWNDLSDLTSQSDGMATTTYGYNASGLRVWSQSGGGAKKFYIYSGSKLIGEVQAGGSATCAYTWGPNGPVSERLIGSSTSRWYAFGPQGETRQLTDGSGAVVDTYLYTPAGVPISTTGADANSFRFGAQAGYYTDLTTGTGTVLCGLRWYDPYLDRWLSRDPTGYEGGANLYAYCLANPVGFLDVDGAVSGLRNRRREFTCRVFRRHDVWSDGLPQKPSCDDGARCTKYC